MKFDSSRVMRLAVCVAVVMGLVSLTTEAASAQSKSKPKPDKLTIVTTTATVSWAPFWVALVTGEFAKENLDVNYQLVPNNALGASMIAGQGDISISAVPSPLLLAKSGRDTRLIYNMVEGVSYVAGATSVKTLKDCKKVVTTSLGTTSYAWTVLLKELFDATFDIVQLGEVSLVPPALLSGRGDCASLNYAGLAPVLTANPTKFHGVFDSTDKQALPDGWPGPISTGAIWGMKDTIAKKRPVIVRFLRALDKGRQRVKSPVGVRNAVNLLRTNKDFASVPYQVLLDTYVLAIPTVSPNDGFYTEKGFNTMLRWAANAGLSSVGTTPKWKIGDRTDLSLLKEALKR